MNFSIIELVNISSVHFHSVAQLCLTLWGPMNRSTPGIAVHHQLPEFTQTHAHWVSDAIQTPHPLSSPCPPAFNLSQHQGLFKWVSSLHQVVGYLRLQICKRSMSVYVESGLELKFFNESALHIRRPKYWNFSFSISPSNKYSRLISFRIDWFGPFAVQGTLKSLLQHQKICTMLWTSSIVL